MSHAERVAALSTRLSVLAAAGTAVLSVLVLTGWATGALALARIVPAFPMMAPAVAVGLLVASAGLLSVRLVPSRGVQRAVCWCSAVVLVTGAVMALTSYAVPSFDVFDHMLFAERLERVGPHAGRPAPETAIAMASLGVALPMLTANRIRAVLLADLLGAVATLVAVAGLVAFAVSDVALFPGFSGSATGGIALPTALGLWALGMGVLTARPDRGLVALAASPGAGGMLMRRMLPTLGLAPVLVSFLALLVGSTGILSPAVVYGVLGMVNVVLIVLALLLAAQRLDMLDNQRTLAVAAAEHRRSFDPLTGLANRAHFVQTIEAATARRHAGGTAVVVVDVDHLRAVNDTMGGDAGDALLVAIAERLLSSVRPGDLVARVGGDEFAVLCQDVGDPEEANRLADRLAAAVRRPVRTVAGEVAVTAAVGLAYCGDGTRADCLHAAEMALSRAKAAGPGQVGRYDERLREETGGRYRIEQDLRRALESGEELALHYQPIIDLRTGSVRTVEALLRWAHPQRGMVPANLLLDVAAEAGLLPRVGDRVLALAAGQAAEWQHLDLRVYANLSGVEVARPDLAERVLGAAEAAGCPPRRLGIEVTEQHLLADPETAHVGLSTLRREGIGIAIDDFGTGYSSLTYLRRLPVDRLKIDGSLVRALSSDPAVVALVSAAVQMGHALGLTVVGEAVEDVEHEVMLFEVGAEAAQGYLYAPALPAAELEQWLRGHSGLARHRPDVVDLRGRSGARAAE